MPPLDYSIHKRTSSAGTTAIKARLQYSPTYRAQRMLTGAARKCTRRTHQPPCPINGGLITRDCSSPSCKGTANGHFHMPAELFRQDSTSAQVIIYHKNSWESQINYPHRYNIIHFQLALIAMLTHSKKKKHLYMPFFCFLPQRYNRTRHASSYKGPVLMDPSDSLISLELDSDPL